MLYYHRRTYSFLAEGETLSEEETLISEEESDKHDLYFLKHDKLWLNVD